jgi:hypothetical protein
VTAGIQNKFRGAPGRDKTGKKKEDEKESVLRNLYGERQVSVEQKGGRRLLENKGKQKPTRGRNLVRTPLFRSHEKPR